MEMSTLRTTSVEVEASFDLLEQLRQKHLDPVVGPLPPEKDILPASSPGDGRGGGSRAQQPSHLQGTPHRIADAAGLPWVLADSQAPSRQWLEAAFASRGLPPRRCRSKPTRSRCCSS